MARNAELQTSASLKDEQRSHRLAYETLWPSVTWRWEQRTPDAKGESCCERMPTLNPTSAYSRGDGDLFA